MPRFSSVPCSRIAGCAPVSMILPAAAAAASAAAEAAWPVGTRSGGGSAGAGGGVGAGAGAGAGAAADEERRAEDSGDGVPTTEGARYLFLGVVDIV